MAVWPKRADSEQVERSADLAGIDLGDTHDQIVVGAQQTTGRPASVQLELRQGKESHAWAPTVYFCDPWPWAFGLLRIGGLDPFLVMLDVYEEWLELHPLNR